MYKHRYNYPKEYGGQKTANQSKNRKGKKNITQNADISEDRKKKNGVERLSCTVSCLKT